MTDLEKQRKHFESTTRDFGQQTAFIELWNLTIEGDCGVMAFCELLDVIKKASAEKLLGNRQGFRLRLRSDPTQYVRRMDGLWCSKTGKTWATEGHLKAAMSYQFGTYVAHAPKRPGYRSGHDLEKYEVLNIATGEISDALDLWMRRSKK